MGVYETIGVILFEDLYKGSLFYLGYKTGTSILDTAKVSCGRLGAVSFGLLLGLGALALACCATKPTQRHVQPFQPFQEPSPNDLWPCTSTPPCLPTPF